MRIVNGNPAGANHQGDSPAALALNPCGVQQSCKTSLQSARIFRMGLASTLESTTERTQQANVYIVFGLRISSEIPLSELFPQPESDSLPPDVFIGLGTLPGPVPGHETVRGEVEPGATNREIVLRFRDLARYRVRDGREIVIEPFPAASERKIRVFLLGSVFGALCHQRRMLLLHANAILVDGAVMAFAGPAGIGKSTLAAWFQSRGYQILSDDLCVVDFGATGRPQVWPGLPRLKLWRDAAETFGHDSTTLEPTGDGRDKYHLPLPRDSPTRPFPLSRLYVLTDFQSDASATPLISPLHGAAALHAVTANTFRNEYLQPMGLVRQNFDHALTLAKHVGIFSAPRERGLDVLDRECLSIEEHMKQANHMKQTPTALEADSISSATTLSGDRSL